MQPYFRFILAPYGRRRMEALPLKESQGHSVPMTQIWVGHVEFPPGIVGSDTLIRERKCGVCYSRGYSVDASPKGRAFHTLCVFSYRVIDIQCINATVVAHSGPSGLVPINFF
jgi:hypothetical protein